MKKSAWIIVVLFLLIYILPLGVRPLVFPDETRYAEIPREMPATGDWTVPHLDGIRYFEKPVLSYWIDAFSTALLGENRFAVRLPSALAVALAALFIYLLVSRASGDPWKGTLSSVIYLTSMGVYAAGVYNSPDSLLSMFLTAGMVLFFLSHVEEHPTRRAVFLALFGVFCGLAFLTKGFLAFAVPVVAIVPFMIWEGQWKKLFTIPWIPAIAALLVALPWSVMIHLREGRFWHYFFWVEHIQRFFSNHPQHPKPFWYFVPVIAGGALPWTVLIPAAIGGSTLKKPRDSLLRFSFCWLIFPFLFFTASNGKLGTYILPCFPPLAILMAYGLTGYFQKKGRKSFNRGALTLAASAGLIGAILLTAHLFFPTGNMVYAKGETLKWALGTAGFLSIGTVAWLASRASNPIRKITLFAVAPVLFLFVLHFAIPGQSMERKMPGPFIKAHTSRIFPDSILVSDNYLAPAVCWFYKRSDVYLLEKGGEFTYGLTYGDSKGRLLTIDKFKEMAEKGLGKGRLVLITHKKRYEAYRDRLPKPIFMDEYGKFVFVQF